MTKGRATAEPLKTPVNGYKLAVNFAILLLCGLASAVFTAFAFHLPSDGIVPNKYWVAYPSRDDYFVFAQGCVPMPGDNGLSCTNPPQIDWQNPLLVLRTALCMSSEEFTRWSASHVGFVKARSADYKPVMQTVTTLPTTGHGLFLIGHSAGGAAIANYLLAQVDGAIPDAKVSGAYLMDAPLSRENLMQIAAASWAGFYEADRMNALVAWAIEHKVDLRVLSYADDWLINPTRAVWKIGVTVIPRNVSYNAGPWEFMLKHNYVLFDSGGARDFLGSIFGAGCAP